MKVGYIIKKDAISEIRIASERLRASGELTIEDLIYDRKIKDVAAMLNRGDTIVVCSILDVCSSINNLFKLYKELQKKGILIKSLDEPYLSSDDNPGVSDIMVSLSDLNAKFMSLQTKKGLSKVRSEGIKLGRPKGITKDTEAKIRKAEKMYRTTNNTVVDICRITGCTPRTFYRYVEVKKLIANYEEGD